MNPTPVAPPDPARIFGTLHAFQESAALKAAIELDVFSAVGEGVTTSPELAARCGTSERGMRILCDTLVAIGLLQKQNGTYANTPEGSFFLDTKSPAYMGTVARFLCTPEMVSAAIMGTADCVRQGRTMLPGQGTVDPENPVWVSFAEAMAPMMMPAAQAIAAQLPASGPMKVLDIAAGHGLFGITIAQKNPEAQIVALDWRAVLEVATRNATASGVADRYTTLAGSAFDVDFGSDYDVILITNFLHHFSPETNETLLRKVHAALKTSGRAITLEFVPDESRVSPPPAARFALTMLTSTAEGDAYTFAELSAMARNAGFADSTQIPLHAGQSVIISTK